MKKKTNQTKMAQFKSTVQKFKKAVEQKLGKIKWAQIGIYTLFLLIVVAMLGLLGSPAQTVALTLFSLYRTTIV